MAKPTKIKNKNGTISYRIFVNKTENGVKKRESKTFSERNLAVSWADKRKREIEHELVHGVKADFIIRDIIQQYHDQFSHNFGVTKNYDIMRLINYPVADILVSKLSAKIIIDHCIERNKNAQPQTVFNDVIWLRVILKTMAAILEFDYPGAVFESASIVLRREKLIAKSVERSRRPTRAELMKLSRFFYKSRSKIPMLHIMWFAIYSTRRMSEITRIEWADNNESRTTGMVRDAKHPRDKKGNHRRFKYTQSAWKIVCRQEKIDSRIFPFNTKTIGTKFGNACRTLGIKDLHFHDLRHEAASRLFEAGYSIEQVQLFTLHENWQTLARYTHLSPEDVELK